MDEMLAKDLAVIWQSELTAMAADRELREAALTIGMFWANAAFAAAALPGAPAPANDGPAGSALTPEPARTAAVVAASEPSPDAERHRRRIAELGQRLAELAGERPGGTRSGGF